MRRSLVGTAVLVAVAIMLAGLTVVDAVPAGAAVIPAPATSNPEESTAPPCDPRVDFFGCAAASPSLIQSRIPIDAGDAAGVNALQAKAENLVVDQHDWDRDDPRLYQWGQPDVWGAMWDILIAIVRKNPVDRTAEEQDAYFWFQHVVQQYKIKATEKAQAEYNNWKSQQCAYKPGAPAPAYTVGGGCTGSIGSLFTGARVPTFEELQSWGAYQAAQTLGTSASTAMSIGEGVAAGLIAGSAAAGSAAALTYVATASAATGAAVGGSMADISALSTVAGSAFAGAGAALIFPIIAIAIFVATIVALVVSIIQQAQYAEIPDKLQGAINDAKNNLPNLQSMTNDTTAGGGNLLFALFVGQTLVQRPWPAPFVFPTPKPSWRGDILLSQSFDTSVNPAVASGGVVESRALSVKSWGDPWDAITKAPPVNGGLPPVIWLTDRGWFQQSIDNGSNWTTNSSLRYLDWDGKRRTAMIRGGRFIDLSSDGGSTSNPSDKLCPDSTKCTLTSTLKLLDANGTPVQVSVDPALPVPAEITDNGHFKQGETTTFTNPNSNTRGGPAVHKWEIEGFCPVGQLCISPASFSGGPDYTPFNGHPVITLTGQTVQHTWPAAGTFHVRLTTTNNAGTRVSDRDVTVSYVDTPPTITYKRVELGPLYDDGTAHVTGCLDTLPGNRIRPRMTINWGDGTTQTAQPLLYAQFLDVGQAPPPEPAFSVLDGAALGCTTAWSFSAHHQYLTPSDAGYQVGVTAEDGDGRTTVSQAGVAEFIPSDFGPSSFGFTNNFGATHDGMPLFDEGKSANLRIIFPDPPDRYGQRLDVDWDDGIQTSPFRSCPIGQTTDCFPTEFNFTHTFWSSPGTTGFTTRTVTLTLRETNGTIVRQFTTPVAIKNVGPTIKTLTRTGGAAQGEEVTIAGTIGLEDNDTPLAIKISWTDSTGTANEAINIGPVNGDRSFEAKHVVREDGTRMDLSITDNAGGTKTGSMIIGLTNVPPSPKLDPVAVDQGTPLQLSVLTGDPGTDKFTQTVDWGDGTTPDVQSDVAATNGRVTTLAHTYSVPGQYDVSVTLNDGHGGEGTVESTVGVDNVKPVVGLSDVAGVHDAPVTLNGTITDPGSQDSFTGTVDWRDGSAPESFTRPVGATSFSLSHTYDDGGLYPVIVNVADNRGGTSDDASAEIAVDGPPVFTANDPPDAVVGQPVGYQFSTHAFPLPTYTVTEGSLPPGLTLRDDGWLEGTPTDPGSYPLRVQASNTFGSQTSPVITLDVLEAPVFTADTPPNAIVGRPYSYTFDASGIPAPTFAVDSGALPAGLALNPTTGVLSGTPTAVGSSAFAIKATNAAGSATTPSRTIDVIAVPTISVGDASGPENGTLAVPVSLSHAAPEAVRVSFATENGTARAGQDYVAQSGQITFAPGETSKDVLVTILGDPLDEVDETFNLRLSGARVGTLGDRVGVNTIQDDDAPPTVGVGNASVTEGPAGTKTTMSFAVQLSAPSGRTVRVRYATSNGSATPGSDYTAASGTLRFDPGQTTKTVSVKILGDGLDEFDESFGLALSDLENVGAGDLAAIGEIIDDDAPPKLTGNDASVLEGGPGTTSTLSFKLRLSARSGKTVNVSFATADGTAQAPGDYVAQTGTVTFAPGETEKFVPVTVLGDSTREGSEKLALWLSSAEAVVGSASVTGTIKNDD